MGVGSKDEYDWRVSQVPHSRPWITERDIEAVSSQLKGLLIAHGELSETFGAELGQYVGAEYCVTANSGTQALARALSSLRLREGAKVLIPAYVCHQVQDAVSAAGYEPVIGDVNDSGVLEPSMVERAALGGVKAVVAVHVFGHPCDVEGMQRVGLPVIEDACQALGLRVGGQMAGSIGTLGVFSTHATKCISSGEGGAVVTSDADLVSSLLRLPQEARNLSLAGNLSDLGASLALSQLRRYGAFIERRQQIDNFYKERAASLGLDVGGPNERDFVFRFTLILRNRLENALDRLWNAGISARRGVDRVLRGSEPTPRADALFSRTLSLPFHPSLTDSEVERVADAMRLLTHG